MARVLAIGDTHAPFTHKGYLYFLQDVYKEYELDTVVHIGDLVDNHALSFHDSEPEAYGVLTELDKACQWIEQLVEVFPEAKLCLGNHDEIVHRKAKTVGMGSRFVKTFREIYGLPDTWDVGFYHEIDDVLYQHGTGSSGKYAHVNLASKNMQSTVQGHTHSNGGVQYMANRRQIVFGLNTGCGIDPNMWAFAYGKHFVSRPTLGCGVVIDGEQAMYIPMSQKYFDLADSLEILE